MAKNIPITFRWLREVIEFEWDRKDRKSVCAISFVLLKYADADGQNCFPSVATVAFEAGVSEETVRRIYKTMRGKGYLRKTAKTQDRYRTNIYRLIYPTPSGEIPLGGGVSTVKSAGSTKGTESPTGDDSSPDGDFVAPPATSQPIISEPSAVDEDIVALEFLRPYFERGEWKSVAEPRVIAQKYSEEYLSKFNFLTKFGLFSDLMRAMNAQGYHELVGVLSGEITDRIIVNRVIKDSDSAFEFPTSDALVELRVAYAKWRQELESGWYDEDNCESEALFESDLGVRFSTKDGFFENIKDVGDLLRAIDNSRARVMAIRDKARNIPDGRPVGGDPIITLDIVESAEVVADAEKDIRW